MRSITKRLPYSVKQHLKSLRRAVRSLFYIGNNRYCPICQRASRKFATAGLARRTDALCVHCDALERHRLIWLYLTQCTNLFDGTAKQVLHIAPEHCFRSRFRAYFGNHYITADLFDPSVMVRMDIIPTLGVQSSSDQRAALPARPCHPAVWSGACGAVPIHVIARARQRPKQSPPSAGSAPQRPLLLSLLPAGAGLGVRARRS